MSTLVVLGRDGKHYPLGLPRPRAEYMALVALSHTLRCIEHLSYPQMQQALLDRYGVRRSLGSVWNDVNAYRCPRCGPQQAVSAGHSLPPAPPAPPDPRQRPQAFEWR